jgi:hypothetical protein
LPQSDYLITEDQILTHDFGKHKISNGSVNAGGKGELFSNWFFNSLREELEPTVVCPSIVSLDTKVSPDAPKYEVGSIINKIEWEASINSGEYEFGTLENKDDKLP